MALPTDRDSRKSTPIYSGVMKYFPLALAAVARVSVSGNETHNAGQPLHWAREKSTDHEDCIARHLVDHATGAEYDTDGEAHMAKVAWRALAMLQIMEEARADQERLEKLYNRHTEAAANDPDLVDATEEADFDFREPEDFVVPDDYDKYRDELQDELDEYSELETGFTVLPEDSNTNYKVNLIDGMPILLLPELDKIYNQPEDKEPDDEMDDNNNSNA